LRSCSKMRFILAIAALFALLACTSALCPDWDYAGAATWGDLCDEYHQCSGVNGGVEQSPIDIAVSASVPRPTVSFLSPLQVYGDNTQKQCVLTNTGKGLNLTLADNSKTTLSIKGGRIVDGVFLDIASVVVHTPAEHTINGVTNDVELQVYFNRPVIGDPRGRNTVAASFFFSVDTKNSKTQKKQSPILNNLFFKKTKGQTALSQVQTDGSTFSYNIDFVGVNQLFNDPNWVTYDGSKTTPDCDQSIEWYIFIEKMRLSTDQLTALQHFGNNARPVQELGSRVPWFFRPLLADKNIASQ